MGSESVDSDGDPSAEVNAAHAGHAAAGDASKHRLVGTDANTDGSEEDDKHNCTHAGVDVRPARSSFDAVYVSVAVFCEVNQEISSSLDIAEGSCFAASVINDVVKINVRSSESISILSPSLNNVDSVESSVVKSAENESNDTKANGLTQNHLLMSLVLSGDHGFRGLHREHHLHLVHFRSGFCVFNNYRVLDSESLK